MRSKLKKSDYDKYYKQMLPLIKKDKNQKYLFIILTLSVSIFFALFAINPTLSTIVKLRKELSDSKFVNDKLTQKVNNLSTLSTQYQNIEDDLPLVLDAIPVSAEAPLLIGQIQSLADEHSVNFTNISISPINLIASKATKSSSLTFELSGSTSYENFNLFFDDLVNIQRVIVVESISISKNEDLDNININLKGKAFYKAE